MLKIKTLCRQKYIQGITAIFLCLLPAIAHCKEFPEVNRRTGAVLDSFVFGLFMIIIVAFIIRANRQRPVSNIFGLFFSTLILILAILKKANFIILILPIVSIIYLGYQIFSQPKT